MNNLEKLINDAKEEYPLNTFTGETRKELDEVSERIITQAYNQGKEESSELLQKYNKYLFERGFVDDDIFNESPAEKFLSLIKKD